jgi:hypothetical protein
MECGTFAQADDRVVPLITVPVALSLVHYHPEPVDDCPCFEDAIAILAVILGGFVGHWADVRLGMSVPPNLRRGIWDEGAAMGTLITCLRIVIGEWSVCSTGSTAPGKC